jgi:hypothetical protein
MSRLGKREKTRHPGEDRESDDPILTVSPLLGKPLWACTGEVRPKCLRFRVGCAATPEAPLLSYVPVHFDTYRPLPPRLRWAMQCLVSFADHAGRCFPPIRTFAVHAGISKSAAQRDLAELAALGHVSRKRRPGGCYVYKIARRFLPQWAAEQVSQARDRLSKALRGRRAAPPETGVPERGTEEKPMKKNQEKERARANFIGVQEGLPRQTEWSPRLRGWLNRRFWLREWGPTPSEPGCMAPLSDLEAIHRGS